MNFRKKKWLIPMIVAAAIVIAVAGYFLFRPEHPLQFIRNQQDSKNTTQFEGLEIKIPGSNDTGYWELKLSKLVGLDTIGRMYVIRGRYLVNNRPIQFIKADQGKISWEDRRITFEKHVSFKTIEDQSLTTDVLTWDPNRREIKAKGNITLQVKGLSVKTTQLTADLDLKKVTFSGMTQVTTRGDK